MQIERGIYWFREDLRMYDNPGLQQALEKSAKIILLYIFDPRTWKRQGNFRWQFLRESLADLLESLKKYEATLQIRIGKPEEIIPKMVSEHEIEAVFTSVLSGTYEQQLNARLEEKLLPLKCSFETVWQHTLLHKDDIPWPINQLPDVFTQFRKENEKQTPIRACVPKPEKINTLQTEGSSQLPPYDIFGHERVSTVNILFQGGECAAWKRLQHYFWESDQLRNYKFTRNGLLGMDYSSKFSPWLSLGCISPRAIYEEVKRYEKERKKNVSTYWLIFELYWRDYFHFVLKRYGRLLFMPQGIKEEAPEWKEDLALFEKWKNGQTGVPFIDANMRELKATGFMSNRGRQNVASFLVKDLQLPWIWGAQYFEYQLVDYDVASNWGNWAYQAGVGNDPRPNRYFNILSQAKKYDKKGEYVRRWLPELATVEGFDVHHPEKLSEETKAALQLGERYPHPLVNMEKWEF